MKEYLKLLSDVYTTGIDVPTRQGGITRRKFGTSLSFDILYNFPLVTVKETNFDTIKKELAGFLKGAANTNDFYGIKIWDKDVERWAKERNVKNVGHMGRIYGVQWRNWDHKIDQLSNIIDQLAHNPYDRRMVVSAWNPSEFDNMCLPPCHIFYQFSADDKYIDCMFYMRSVDLFLGLPFDIASYALLTHIVGNEVNKRPRKLVVFMGDTHIYQEHFTAVSQVLGRVPKEPPILALDVNASIDNFEPEMAEILGYDPHPPIRVELIA